MNLFNEVEEQEIVESEAMNEEVEKGYEVEMNWNIGHYLPEAASCQEIFKVIIAGHIQALYEKLLEVQHCHDTTGSRLRIEISNVSSSQVHIIFWGT